MRHSQHDQRKRDAVTLVIVWQSRESAGTS